VYLPCSSRFRNQKEFLFCGEKQTASDTSMFSLLQVFSADFRKFSKVLATAIARE